MKTELNIVLPIKDVNSESFNFITSNGITNYCYYLAYLVIYSNGDRDYFNTYANNIDFIIDAVGANEDSNFNFIYKMFKTEYHQISLDVFYDIHFNLYKEILNIDIKSLNFSVFIPPEQIKISSLFLKRE